MQIVQKIYMDFCKKTKKNSHFYNFCTCNVGISSGKVHKKNTENKNPPES